MGETNKQGDDKKNAEEIKKQIDEGVEAALSEKLKGIDKVVEDRVAEALANVDNGSIQSKSVLKMQQKIADNKLNEELDKKIDPEKNYTLLCNLIVNGDEYKDEIALGKKTGKQIKIPNNKVKGDIVKGERLVGIPRIGKMLAQGKIKAEN